MLRHVLYSTMCFYLGALLTVSKMCFQMARGIYYVKAWLLDQFEIEIKLGIIRKKDCLGSFGLFRIEANHTAFLYF